MNLTAYTVNALLTLLVMALVFNGWGIWRIAGLMHDIADGFRRDLNPDEEANREIFEPTAPDTDEGGVH